LEYIDSLLSFTCASAIDLKMLQIIKLDYNKFHSPIADAVGNGWSLDASTKMLTVKKPKTQTNQKLDASKLQCLTECVFHLEH
jgi:hypothetical protein